MARADTGIKPSLKNFICYFIILENWEPTMSTFYYFFGGAVYALLGVILAYPCLLYTSPSPRDATLSRMPSSA